MLARDACAILKKEKRGGNMIIRAGKEHAGAIARLAVNM